MLFCSLSLPLGAKFEGIICNFDASGPLTAVSPVISHAWRGEWSHRETGSSLSITHKKHWICVWLNDMGGNGA